MAKTPTIALKKLLAQARLLLLYIAYNYSGDAAKEIEYAGHI